MSKILEAFGQRATEGLQANRGLGSIGWWPPAESGQERRVVEAVLTGWTVDENEKLTWKKPGNGGETAAVKVTFHYQLLNDPDHDGEPRSFNGRPVILPYDSTNLPEINGSKQKTRVRIAEERFLGFAEALLGSKPSTFGAAFEQMRQLIENPGDTAIVLKVLLSYDKGKPNEEFWQERVS